MSALEDYDLRYQQRFEELWVGYVDRLSCCFFFLRAINP